MLSGTTRTVNRRYVTIGPMDDDLVRRSDSDGVATIELHRPERKNAIIAPMLDELAAHVTAASNDAAVRVVLLCGAGGAFCSGLDLTEYGAKPPPDWLPTAAQSVRQAHLALAACPHPVVVALERYAINGGAAFALAGDLIVTGHDSWLQVAEVRLGMAAPMNLAWLVARYPVSTVLQIVLTGNRFDGVELRRLNIAHEVVDDADVRSRAEELAIEIASYPAGASQILKSAALGLAADTETPVLSEAWFSRAAELAPASKPPPR
jgi:enoyl-CoA hydratase/carnithine racemase